MELLHNSGGVGALEKANGNVDAIKKPDEILEEKPNVADNQGIREPTVLESFAFNCAGGATRTPPFTWLASDET